MTNTPRLNMRRPVGADAFTIADDLQSIVDPLDNAAIDQQGTLAARPTANSVPRGTYYFATDEGIVYRSDGTTWTAVTTANPAVDLSGTFVSRPAANAVADGTYYFTTDTAVLYRSDGTNWHETGFTADRVRVKRAADQAIAAGSFYALEFDTQEIDTNSMWTGGGTSTRLTAQRGGIYHLTAKVNFDVGSTFAADYLAVMAAHYNSAVVLQSGETNELFDFTSGFPNMARHVSWMFDMDAGDFVTVSGKTIGTGAVDLTGIATMVRVSP